MEKMESVPVNIITGKDLDYLSDMFQWNYCAYKKVINEMENINNDEITTIFKASSDLFNDNLNLVLNVLGNPGGDIDE